MKGNITFVREKHKDSYTCISNRCLQDTRLSMGARGLIVQILSLPKSWTLYKAKLEEYNRNSRTSIKTALRELQENGYLIISKLSDNSITYIVNEVPDGTIGIFDKDDVQNVQCDADFEQGHVHSAQYACTNHTSGDAQNVQLLNINKNTNKLTTTKVSQSLFINKLRSEIENSYGFVFSEDFYTTLVEIKNERGIELSEYLNWLINTKGKTAGNIQNYVYKTAGNPNVVNEFLRYSNGKQKTELKIFFQPTVICPSCGHKFTSIDFTMRTCICGFSLDEIQKMKGGQNG